MRYLLGDRPFIDERHTTPISFDLFDLALFRLMPVDNLLVWRLIGLVLSSLSLGFLCYTLWPWLGARLAAALYSACILFAPPICGRRTTESLPAVRALALIRGASSAGAGSSRRRSLVAVSPSSVWPACVPSLLVTLGVVLAYVFAFAASDSKRTTAQIVLRWLATVAFLWGIAHHRSAPAWAVKSCVTCGDGTITCAGDLPAASPASCLDTLHGAGGLWGVGSWCGTRSRAGLVVHRESGRSSGTELAALVAFCCNRGHRASLGRRTPVFRRGSSFNVSVVWRSWRRLPWFAGGPT
jgi:hypothetical protein